MRMVQRRRESVFPTPVGMSQPGFFCVDCGLSVPHTRGDEPGFIGTLKLIDPCSPHPWG